MILFVCIVIGVALYTVFADGWLISWIKDIRKNNEIIEKKIKNLEYNTNVLFSRPYNEDDYETIPKNIRWWFINNIFYDFIIFVIIFMVSVFTVNFCPKTETYYSFNINSLKDNLVESGEFFCMRGQFDGEINYFFSRTTDKGEVVGHIPADKSYIKYNDNATPCIEVHQTNHKVPKIAEKLLFVKMFNQKETDYYVVIVPNGTISVTNTYQIDLE